MEQTEGSISKIVVLPWKAISWVCATSFVAASILSSIIAFIIYPAAPIDSNSTSESNKSNVDYQEYARRESLGDEGTKAVLKRNIFNSDGKLGDSDVSTQDEEVVRSDKAVETTLPIKLVGVIYGGNPYNGLATIENTEKRRVNSFIVGDTIMSSAKLKEILPTRIIIDRDGRIEYCELEEFKLSRNKRKKKKAVAVGPAAIANGPPPESYREDGFVREGGDIKITESYKRRLLEEDFQKTLQDAKATPFKNEAGEIAGFQLTRIRENSIYQKAGFQNDDIVQEINGVQLNSVGGAISLLQRLRSESNVEVRVNRGGQTMTFTLDIQ